MPQTYAGQGQYRVSCNDCGLALLTHGIPTQASAVYRPDGVHELVADRFTWDRNGQRFYSICKTCKAARVARARAGYRARMQAADARAESAPIALTPNLARRFGVEIECISPVSHSALQSALESAGLSGWRVKYDGSLPGGGAEIVGPPLSGEDGIAQVRVACRVLREQGCTVTRQCGLHVHHEIRDVTVTQVKTLARLWSDNQDMIDGLVAPSRRDGRNSYCGRLSDEDLRRLDRCREMSQISSAFATRYRTMNLQKYGRYGTVEIRQHQGTLDAEKIVTWIEFGQAMIEQARCASAFQATRVTQLVENLAHLSDTAGTFLLGRAVRFGAVAI